jgi:archaellum component FlaC
MGGEEKKAGGNLALALQNAAIENINEDIHSINNILEGIKKKAPQIAGDLINELKEDVKALDRALQVVPDKFDSSFNQKMNAILDLLTEVNAHSSNLEKTVKSDISDTVDRQAVKLADEFNKKIKGYSVTSLKTLLFYGLCCSLLGGLVTALLVWNIFPKIF